MGVFMGQILSARAMRDPRIVAAGILGCGCILSLALNLPGQLSYDSIAQLHDGRVGVYNDWHPPIMAWMLGVADSIVPGAGLFVVFDQVLLFGSMLSLLWLAERPSWRVPVVAIVCALLPQFLLYQGIVWKDVLFANSAIAGFVSITNASARWERPAMRNALLFAGIVLLALAALARQNGAVALVFGIAAIATVATMRASGSRFGAGILYGSIASALAICLVSAASLALALRTPGESGPQAQLKLLQAYDIIGAVKSQPGLKLDVIAPANPDLDELIRSDGVRLYTPQRNDTLAASADLQGELTDTPKTVIFAQWREIVTHHPWLYLTVRARVFAWIFLTPDISRCNPTFVGVKGLPSYMRDLGLTARVRSQDAWLKAYGNAMAGTPALSHVAYLILLLAELVVLIRRRTTADAALAYLLVSAVAFTLSFFVISIACDYRYLVFLDLSGLAVAVYLAGGRPKIA
jgi:hypothetical protein